MDRQYFVIYALDKVGKQEARAAVRPAHRSRLRRHDYPLVVHVGGPLEDDSGKMCGTMLIVEASDKSVVENFLKEDPYSLAGVYDSVAIHAYNWGLGPPAGEING